jgi:hypothetical protein
MEHSHVEILIDKKKYDSPNPTTGSALYLLGSVDPKTYDLYREIPGKGDDELIPNDHTVITLKDGEHFFTVQKKLNPGSLWL